MELVLVRHAESIWNAEERWQGQTDVPLSERGRREASCVAERLRGVDVDVLVSSDLERARDTAEAIRSASKAPPSLAVVPGLREMNLGAWCGLPHAEVRMRFASELMALAQGADVSIGGGESIPRFEDRVHEALGGVLRIARERGARRVLVVTHGGCIRAVIHRLLGLRGRVRPLEGARNTSLTTLGVGVGDALVLETYNDSRHIGRSELALGEERVVGPSARERVGELLQLTSLDGLAVPSEETETRIARAADRLVEYAVPC